MVVRVFIGIGVLNTIAVAVLTGLLQAVLIELIAGAVSGEQREIAFLGREPGFHPHAARFRPRSRTVGQLREAAIGRRELPVFDQHHGVGNNESVRVLGVVLGI